MVEFTHFDSYGRPQMVDISGKLPSMREATALARVKMKPETLQAIKGGKISKGDVLSAASLAGVLGAKATASIIPLCHQLALTSVKVDFRLDVSNNLVEIQTKVKTTGRTGVEMEALSAACAAALTIYDMVKSIDRTMSIERVVLLEKKGGRTEVSASSPSGSTKIIGHDVKLTPSKGKSKRASVKRRTKTSNAKSANKSKNKLKAKTKTK